MTSRDSQARKFGGTLALKLKARTKLVPRSQSSIRKSKPTEFILFCIECDKKAEYCIPDDANIVHCADHAKPKSVQFSIQLQY